MSSKIIKQTEEILMGTLSKQLNIERKKDRSAEGQLSSSEETPWRGVTQHSS